MVFGQILNAATFHLRGRALTLSPGSELLAGIFGLSALQCSGVKDPGASPVVDSWNGLGEKGQGHLPLDQGAPSPV